MKTITIYLRRSKKIGSRVICLATGEPYSHIGVELGGFMYHSVSSGCRKEAVVNFTNQNEVYSKTFPVLEREYAAMIERAETKLSTKYDMLGVIAFGLMLILRRVGIIKKIADVNPKWLMCSEYAEWILWGKVKTITPMEVLSAYENQVRLDTKAK